MPDTPDNLDLWHEVNQARLDIAELRGMVKMHFEDRQHHIPPCKPAAEMQKTWRLHNLNRCADLRLERNGELFYALQSR